MSDGQKVEVTDWPWLGGRISLGQLGAAALSYSTHHNILWAIIHGCFSWFYILYWSFTYLK